MWYNKSQFVLKMSTKSFDTSTKTSTPLSDCGIDDALIQFIARGDDFFSQLTDVIHVVFGTRMKLLFTAPNFLKRFVDFWEKMLWNDSAIRQNIRGPFFGSRCTTGGTSALTRCETGWLEYRRMSTGMIISEARRY